MNGKSGTITPDEFENLSEAAGNYGAVLLAKKVAKICSKFSTPFKHEYSGSAIAAAWLSVSTKISTALGGTGGGVVSTDTFEFLGSLVNTYGPEVVIQKLSKIAKKNGNMNEANTLKALFPVVAATPPAGRRAAA